MIFRRRHRSGGIPVIPSRHHSVVTWERGHVRGGVVRVGQGAAEIIGVAAAPVHGIGRTTHPDLDRWVAGCEKALSQAEEMTVASNGHKVVPDHVVMAIPSEITEGLPILISRRRHDPKSAITYDEVTGLIRRGYRRAQDVLGARSEKLDRDIVAGTIAEVALDDRVVDDPVGLQGEFLQLRMHFCLSPYEWIRALQIVCERLELGLTAIVPQHMAYGFPLTDSQALLVLLDEHHSTVSIARHGRLEWAKLVELGEQEIIAETGGTLGLHGRQTGALMRAYRAGQLREGVEIQVAGAFWIELRKWMAALAAAALEGLRSEYAPSRIYFLDLTRRLPEARSSLETPFWEAQLPFRRCPEAETLSANTIRDVLDCTAQAGGADYLSLRALAHYVAQISLPGNNLDRAIVQTIAWR